MCWWLQSSQLCSEKSPQSANKPFGITGQKKYSFTTDIKVWCHVASLGRKRLISAFFCFIHVYYRLLIAVTTVLRASNTPLSFAMFQDSANCVRFRRMVSGLNTGHTQKNSAVLIVFTIKIAPFFCVCPVRHLKTRGVHRRPNWNFLWVFSRLHDVLSTDGDSLDPCYEIWDLTSSVIIEGPQLSSSGPPDLLSTYLYIGVMPYFTLLSGVPVVRIVSLSKKRLACIRYMAQEHIFLIHCS
jgi:hypothetical protein